MIYHAPKFQFQISYGRNPEPKILDYYSLMGCQWGEHLLMRNFGTSLHSEWKMGKSEWYTGVVI